MPKLIVLLSLCLVINSANSSDNDIVTANRFYSNGNVNSLAQIFKENKKNKVIHYFYAKALLEKNNPAVANDFITLGTTDYLRNDIIHNLLNYYYNNDISYYRSTLELLPSDQVSVNEKCGLDIANLLYKKGSYPQSDIHYLVNNNLPPWCAMLTAKYYNNGGMDKKQIQRMLFNLLIYNKETLFNQIAPIIGINHINFTHYKSVPISKLPNNDFLAVNFIATIAEKDPTQASKELRSLSIDEATNSFINNYIAMQYAKKHMFRQSINLFEKYGNYLSDDEYEWLARSYLYYAKWDSLIKTIKLMPDSLRNKNVWLYWLAKSYDNTGDSNMATKYLEAIPSDYSYYSMLADSELDKYTTYKTNPPENSTIDESANSRNALLGLNLYKIGVRARDRNLRTIGAFEWYYAAKSANNDKLLLAMSNLAKQNNLYDLSIYAANQMENRYIELSFPLVFWDIFSKYSNKVGIDATYSTAISRQESRFNYKVVAIDGGVGLMQIMPQTANYIAKKSGYANCYSKSADCNIKFGTWYLANLYSKFGNLIYTTAAYNAGPTRPKMWQDALIERDNRIQIELIPITITRDYVQKVISNKAIYDSELAKKNKIDLLSYIQAINNRHYTNIPDDDHTDAYKLR